MRAVIRTRGPVRSAGVTRRDLLLETLALRHQLGVLARSKRRVRPADRLFWLFLRWLWPRWREALVLIQSATVEHWHREGRRRCWRRRSRRPGRPRIDSPCRDLIRRMAAENCLWGAPRIHGELLKLGIAISERTVSRYLHGRPTTRSQTWRTFFANHFGDQTFISPLMFADAHDDNIVVDASDRSFRPVPSIDASCASIHRPSVDWGRSLQPSSLGARLGHNHFPDGTAAHKSSGRDPPRHLPLQPALRRSRRLSFCGRQRLCDRRLWESICTCVLGHRRFRVSTGVQSSRQRRRRLTLRSPATCLRRESHGYRSIGEPHLRPINRKALPAHGRRRVSHAQPATSPLS